MKRSLLNQASLTSGVSQYVTCAEHIYISPSGDNIMSITIVPYLISHCMVYLCGQDNEDKVYVCVCLSSCDGALYITS